MFKYAGITVTENQLCAGGMAGKDTCGGDSGGSLMKQAIAKTKKNQIPYLFLAGIVSYGTETCAVEGWPGVYTVSYDFAEKKFMKNISRIFCLFRELIATWIGYWKLYRLDGYTNRIKIHYVFC